MLWVPERKAHRPAPADLLDPDAEHRFADLLAEHCGVRVDARVRRKLALAVRERLAVLGLSDPALYFQRITRPALDLSEIDHIAVRLTVGETSFFRSPPHFEALRQHVLPALFGPREDPDVRILCAGCSSGEEAYSIAITLREGLGRQARLQVHALDLDGSAIAAARRAVYGGRSMRRVPDFLRERYFEPCGQDEWRVRDTIQALVTFERGNLKECPPESGPPFDVVFCRNTLIYFERREIVLALRRFASLLRPDGFLFLGQTEAMFGQLGDFDVVQPVGGFLFRRRSASRERPPAPAPVAKGAPTFASAPPPASPPAPPPAPPPLQSPTVPPTKPPRTEDDLIARAVEHVRRDDFDQAERLFEQALARAPASPLAALGRAFVLANRDRDADARAAVERALELDPFLPEAYFLAGILLEKEGDLGGAERQYMRTVLLDRDFALAWFYLGNLYLREGNLRAARREFRRALKITERARPPRGALPRLFPDQMVRDFCRRRIARAGGLVR
ncbi:MAG TPA: CheR family methyltransferase [Polyangia bacterium]|nr:CheR family methyltransferase [Polyangia bacterium]